MKYKEYRAELELDIQKAYEDTPTIEDAERLAAKFLSARIFVGQLLKSTSLDARMKRTGVKAQKAGTLLAAVTSGDKKPADSILVAMVDSDKAVIASQNAFDEAEVEAAELENFLEVTKEAHIYFRGLSKGRID